jgi:hypothetical protein
MNCLHRSGNHCGVVARLANLSIVDTVTDAACNVCQSSSPAMDRNKVTLDLAIAALRKAGRSEAASKMFRDNPDVYRFAPVHDQSFRLKAVQAGSGVGSHLWRLLAELGISHDSGCSCLQWAEMLNGWGVAGSRLARDEIADHLKQEAKKLGWKKLILKSAKAAIEHPNILGWIDLTDVYGSIVDEAVRRAEQGELKKAADEFARRDDD